MNGKLEEQAAMFRGRLLKRYKHLKKWARRSGTDAYRLYDRDIPEIPLVMDLYGDAVSGALYERPYEKDEEAEEQWLGAMKAAAAEALGLGEDRIFLKQRRRGAVLYEISPAPRPRSFYQVVQEGGLRFRVNLSGYLDTGLFLDRRKLRALVREGAGGKRVLNLFCYTASFSAAAAAGGAVSVDSVDLSRTYLRWGIENFRLNGFGGGLFPAPEALGPGNYPARGEPYRFIPAEALSFIAGAKKRGLSWDRVILDPPTFSNSKRMRGTLDIQRDHRELITRALGLLCPGGILYFSVNARRFRLDGAFTGEDSGGLGVRPFKLRDLGSLVMDEDFRGRPPPRCYAFEL
ncbi:MAG: class I SAM-dependent methyltransferase [Treponema sp.]|jgi:23S rRNA G2069 N7-methylase RlmK/C1962 C5-methylase RlmI|nr:class I SAM-dependent methyltransferase [Treponema sp.]